MGSSFILLRVRTMSVLLSPSELSARLGRVTVLDVRWELPGGADRAGYERGHVPGAAFVDLDQSLAARPGSGGRHPLPEAAQFGAAMRTVGVSAGRGVVVYDGGISAAAARAWWLLRYFGHPDVRVLDGGLRAWTQAGLALGDGIRPVGAG